MKKILTEQHLNNKKNSANSANRGYGSSLSENISTDARKFKIDILCKYGTTNPREKT